MWFHLRETAWSLVDVNVLKCRGILIVILFASMVPCRADGARTDQVGEIEEMLGQLRQLTGVPAYSVAIVQHGRLVLESAAGEVDSRNHFQASPEHRFRLASVSKAVGATMLAKPAGRRNGWKAMADQPSNC